MRLPSKLFNLNDPGWGRGNNGSGDESGRQQPPRGGKQGPPDLDDLWRDFNGRLGSVFGKKPRKPGGPFDGGGGNNGQGGGFNPSPRGTRIGLGVALAVGVGLWLASGFFIVQEGNVGVITRFGSYTTTVPAGFQWRMPYPIEAAQLVDVSQLRTFEIGFRGNARSKMPQEALMLTDDENIVDLQFVVQYRIRGGDGARDYLFNDRAPDEAVRMAAETAMREVVGKTTMDFVLYEGRTKVASDAAALMQQIMDRYGTGILISTVAILNAQPPEQVQAAFDDAVKAGQDRERQINEGQAYANQVVPLASGTASRMLEQAQGYRSRVVNDARGNAGRFSQVLAEYRKAPEIMRDRLYLETMQQIYTNVTKVMIDTANGNNLMYLPLDKIMQQVSSSQTPRPNAAPTSPQPIPMTTAPTTPVAPAAAQRTTGSQRSLDRDSR